MYCSVHLFSYSCSYGETSQRPPVCWHTHFLASSSRLSWLLSLVRLHGPLASYPLKIHSPPFCLLPHLPGRLHCLNPTLHHLYIRPWVGERGEKPPNQTDWLPSKFWIPSLTRSLVAVQWSDSGSPASFQSSRLWWLFHTCFLKAPTHLPLFHFCLMALLASLEKDFQMKTLASPSPGLFSQHLPRLLFFPWLNAKEFSPFPSETGPFSSIPVPDASLLSCPFPTCLSCPTAPVSCSHRWADISILKPTPSLDIQSPSSMPYHGTKNVKKKLVK